MSMRTFTIVGVSTPKKAEKEEGCLGGVFKSKTPVGAAKKASKRICKACGMKGQCTVIVHIRETTMGSKKKEYVYKIRRVKKDTKVIKRTPDNKKVKITYKYVTKATSLNQFDTL